MKFNKEFEYHDNIEDKRMLKLLDAVNALPGIRIFCTTINDVQPIMIWFNVDTDIKPQGLFFLTRCVDQRYWTFGGKWKISLTIGDQPPLPIHYCLTSGYGKGEEAKEQAESLLENMHHHLNHKSFMKGFNLNVKDFDIYSDLDIRKLKIKNILKNG